MITQERLKELINYNPETGDFLWINAKRGMKAGTIAKCVGNHGYIKIKVDKKSYLAHRLAFLYMTGRFPDGFIDHKNLNKQDNTWANLRECTGSQNQINRLGNKKRNFPKGVKAEGNKFAAIICKDRKRYYLGSFQSPELAFEAYKEKALEMYGEFANFG